MTQEPITNEVSKRICKHMNKDHKDSLVSYAKYYGGIDDPNNVELLEITEKCMNLLVDGNKVEINFDHILKDSLDAHKTLVAMLRTIPK